MESFKEMEKVKESDIICGKAEIDYQAGITNDVFEFAAEIRQKLGEKGYLVETYLSSFFDGAWEVCSEVFSEIVVYDFPSGSDLRKLIICVMDGKTNEHPFYETVKTYIDTHPLEYQEKTTRQTFYFIALFGDYFKYRADEQQEILRTKLDEVMDITDLNCLQTEIDAIIGPEPMEKLNILLYQAFLFVPPMSVFMQNMTTSLMDELIYRDKETSRTMAGLWLDKLSD